MKAHGQLFLVGLRQVLRDGMLLVLLPAPFLIGLALRLLLRLADGWSVSRFGWSLSPWLPLSDAFLMALTPLMVALVSAFLMLDERDEGIGAYFSVTPAGGRAYLLARLGWPLLWAFGCTLLVQWLFGLSTAGPAVILSTALISSLQAVAMAMLLVALAANKVEGLALSKLTGVFLLGLPAPWLLGTPTKFLLAFLPSFWMGELLHSPSGFAPLALMGGLLAAGAWALVLIAIFQRRARL